MRNKENLQILILVSLVLLVQLPMLLNAGLFWDDWTLFNMSQEGIDEQFIGNGAYYTGIAHLHYFLLKFGNPVLLYRILTFVLSASSAIIVFKIFSSFNEVKSVSIYLALVFVTVPFNAAKITLICFPYTICFFLFIAAFYLFIQTVNTGNIFLRIVALILFFVSFVTNSLLFFYLVVPAYLVYRTEHRSGISIIKKWLQFSDFMIVPVIYWIIKTLFLRPTDFFVLQEYNAIGLRRLLYTPIQFVVTIKESFLGIISLFYENGYPYFLLLLLVAIGIAISRLTKLNDLISFDNNAKYKNLFLTGCFLFFIASFPYILVGKTPVFFAYESRHQLLLPIGFSFLVVSLIGIVVTERFRALVLITALIVFTTVSIQLQYCYLIGWLKQESVMANLRSNPLPQQYKTIEVIDYTAFYNATDRPIAFYEWCGIVKYVTGKEDRLFITTDFWSDVPPGGTLQDFVDIRTKANAMVQRNMKDYIPDRSCQAMVINPTQYRLDSRNVAALLFTYYFERETFIRQVGRYTSISLKESCSDAVHTILP